ncbi:hypothetical protein FB45DRAFT_1064419 [Roridomyces roridus]|uniref:Uncharacterized protein n=1 Tax=Roridomyces roridus TaxID=1738132 RepID=A0AAD7BAH7_9AGAR|nr:hypothetical protein FB45DRAFT_1064419 [Roridomyces roridus]
MYNNVEETGEPLLFKKAPMLELYHKWLVDTLKFPEFSARLLVRVQYMELSLARGPQAERLSMMHNGKFPPIWDPPSPLLDSAVRTVAESPEMLAAAIQRGFFMRYFLEKVLTPEELAEQIAAHMNAPCRPAIHESHFFRYRLQHETGIKSSSAAPGSDNTQEYRDWWSCSCTRAVYPRMRCESSRHDSRAMDHLQWLLMEVLCSSLKSLGVPADQAEDVIAKWLTSRMDAVLAANLPTGATETPCSCTPTLEPIKADATVNEEKFPLEQTYETHPIRWDFALVGLELGVSIEDYTTAWCKQFEAFRKECGISCDYKQQIAPPVPRRNRGILGRLLHFLGLWK